jgi:hypothetical protein
MSQRLWSGILFTARYRFGAAVALVGMLALPASCNTGALPADAGPTDAAPIPDAPPAKALRSTSGGGTAESASFRGHFRLGAPQPMGRARSQNFDIRLGPVTNP